MKNKIHKIGLTSLLSKGTLAVLGGITLASCGAQMGYTETDGIYYDPSTDKIEQRMAYQEEEEYNHNESIIGQSQKVQKQQNTRYSSKNWGEEQKISTSDWGTYTGVQNNYYYNGYSAWDSPYYYSFYSPYQFGMYNSYFGDYYIWNRFSSPWGYYRHYSPYYLGYYNPWGYNYGFYNWYDPYYTPFYGYGYSPYHRGYGYGYTPYYRDYGYYQTPVRNYRKSDPDTVYRGNNQRNTYNNSWGNHNRGYQRSNSDGFERTSNWGNHNNTPNINRQPSNNQWGGSNNSSNGGFNNSSNWGNTTRNSGNFHDR